MTPDEAAEVARAGIQVELHTHRHRVSNRRDLFVRELQDNSERIRQITGRQPSHFCYPGGFLLPEFPQWLREAGVESATTCCFGLATRDDDPFLLSRVLDASHVTMAEFRAWIAGSAAALPMRRTESSPMQLMEFRDKSLPELVAELQAAAGAMPSPRPVQATK
jgi:peptidoglycan/xylan/chitin deacetylase (PgdA/CDA1 family)